MENDKDDKWLRVSTSLVSMDTGSAFPISRHEEITYSRACVSAPLGPEYLDFKDYRLVEVMADNNEGGAAFAVKIDPSDSHDRTRIWMSDYNYDRWAAKDSLTIAEVLNGRKIYSFWKESSD